MALTLRSSSGAQKSPGRLRGVRLVARFNLVFSSLEEIEKRSQALLEKKKMPGFLDKSKDSQEVVDLVEQLRSVVVYYQVSGNRAV